MNITTLAKVEIKKNNEVIDAVAFPTIRTDDNGVKTIYVLGGERAIKTEDNLDFYVDV